MVSRIFLFVLIVGTVSAATWIGRPPKKPKEFAHQEGCYITEINKVVPYGTVLTPTGYCYRISCAKDLIDYASCGVVLAGDNCYVTKEDLTKPYPNCCPDVKCDFDNNIL